MLPATTTGFGCVFVRLLVTHKIGNETPAQSYLPLLDSDARLPTRSTIYFAVLHLASMHPSLSLDATRSSTLGVLVSSHIQTVQRAVFWQVGVDEVALGQKVSFREIAIKDEPVRLPYPIHGAPSPCDALCMACRTVCRLRDARGSRIRPSRSRDARRGQMDGLGGSATWTSVWPHRGWPRCLPARPPRPASKSRGAVEDCLGHRLRTDDGPSPKRHVHIIPAPNWHPHNTPVHTTRRPR